MSLDDILKTHSIINEEIVEGVKVVYVIPMGMKKKDKYNDEEKKIANQEAKKKYYEKNKEKINSYVAEWRKKKMETDEEFRERQKENKKRYNERKKEKSDNFIS